ncbi:MAG: T9SS type A sorting domain-containing protein [Candidatus Cloacimonetes bacterium]|nr:T9SS type A sorting domain-containing protein [Candidatus Cloacimonadota bacterium]
MKSFGLIIMLLLLSASVLASWVEVSEESRSELFSCEQGTRSAAAVSFNLDGFELEEKEYGGEKYMMISHEQSGKLLEIGLPDLPIFTKALIIPDEGSSRLEIVSYKEQIYKNFKVYPQEALQYEHETPRDNFALDAEFYESKGVFPAEIAWAGEPAIMRDLRLLPITFCPFQYDAGNMTLTVYSEIEVEVITEGTGGVNAKYSDRKRSRAFEEMYKSNTLNYELMGLRDEYQVPTILFICNNDTSVLTNLEYLVEWKRQKGFNVVVATTAQTGTTNTSIKNYIQDAYDNWENPPEYVDIIGDGTGSYAIPTWFTTGGYSGEGDHPYCQLEGNDILGDLIMGRMTFSTIGILQTVISKVLTYEKTPYMGNTAWYNRALITGDPTNSGYSCVAFGKGVKELMLDFEGNFWDDSNFVEVYTPSFASQMNAAVNLGVSFFAYRGFGGTSGWYSGNTTNGYMMPFLVMPTCNANDWYSGTGNVEGFYLMGSTTTPSGGIGAMGTATSGTHTPFNNAIAIGVWGGIFRDNIYIMGGAVLQGKYYLWLTFPQASVSNYVTQFSHWNSLMGDGTVELWTRLPQTMTVVNASEIASGQNYYEVAVTDSIGNAAEGAWVTLYGEDEDFVATGYCDYSGNVILDIAEAGEGEYTLTVTKHDHIPVIETVEIAEAEQYVDVNNFTIDDAGGNGNGVVNPGESVEIMVTLENLGSVLVSGVSAEIECHNDLVTVVSSEVNFGDISAGGTAAGASGFELEFAANLQGGVEILAELTIIDTDDNEWVTWLYIPIEGASLYASDYNIAGDGVIDPGETENIYFILENNGNLAAAGIEGQLICNNRRITIVDSLGIFGIINPGGSGSNATNRFTVTASMAVLPGSFIPFIIHLTNAEGYDSFVTMNVLIGEAEESDPYGPDGYGYWAYDDGDEDYAKCPVFDWVEIDPLYDGEGTSVSWASGVPQQGEGGGTGTYQNIDLPEDFSLVFYGEEYDEICICTNGWVAPGHHESGNFMNYQIPGPQGPSPMIAVFWDDLNTISGDVLSYYDEDLHYYVVEWSRIENGDTHVDETFEVILYDPLYYPTTTGDSEIKMQYLDVTNNNYGSYPSNHGQYCTVGIESGDSLTGLQYTYNDTYPEACQSLADSRAILFTPPPIPPDGPFLSVNSFHAVSGDDTYIEAGETALISLVLENLGAETAHNVEAEVTINDPYISVIDNSELLGNVEAGALEELENGFSIEISENVPDFYIFYLEVIISCDEDSWNWMLPFTAYWANTFAVDVDSVYYELEPLGTGSYEFTLSNTSDLPVEYYIRTDETTQPGRDVTGSNVTMNTDSFTPGETATWTFTVFNAGADIEWVSDVWLEFPLGVDVLDAENAVGGTGGSMNWDGTTGNGAVVNWHGLTINGWGVLRSGESAVWEVDVQLSTEFAGDMVIGWQVGGDGYGADPHIVSGELTLLYPLRWINLDTSSGILGGGESQVITINFDAGDIEEGMHTGDIVISCDSWDTKLIHVVLNVEDQGGEEGSLPEVLELSGNYPNPFNPETEIFFRIPQAENINLKIYNLKGQYVCTLADGEYAAGSHSVLWKGRDAGGRQVSSGIYFYRLEAGGQVLSSKMALIK